MTDVRNRVLVVGPAKSGKLSIVKELTGTLPAALSSDEGHAGLIHPYTISNKYFTIKVDLWIDEVVYDSEESSSKAWATAFTSPEAREVRDVLAGVIFTFDPKDSQWTHAIKDISTFLNTLEDENWDGVALAASKGNVEDGQLLDLIFDMGFEHVDITQKQRGEGIERIKEALEAYDWASVTQEDGLTDKLLDDHKVEDKGNDDVGVDNDKLNEDEIKSTISNLQYNATLLDTPSTMESSVDNLEAFMDKLRGVRDNPSLTNQDRKALSEELADELLRLL